MGYLQPCPLHPFWRGTVRDAVRSWRDGKVSPSTELEVMAEPGPPAGATGARSSCVSP